MGAAHRGEDQPRVLNVLSVRSGRGLHSPAGQCACQSVRGPSDSTKNQDHRELRLHRCHTVVFDDVAPALVLAGFQVRSGRRNLPRPLPLTARWPYGRNLPEIVPDAILNAEVYLGEAFVEHITEAWGVPDPHQRSRHSGSLSLRLQDNARTPGVAGLSGRGRYSDRQRRVEKTS